MVLSDGADRDSQRDLEAVKQAYEESGILLLIVAYGEEAQDAQTRAALEQLAALSGFAIFEGDTDNIARLFVQLGYTL